MPHSDQPTMPAPTPSEELVEQLTEEPSEQEAESFSGVVIPTVEGPSHSLPGVDLSKQDLKDESIGLRKMSLGRIADGDISEGEKSFFSQVSEAEA